MIYFLVKQVIDEFEVKNGIPYTCNLYTILKVEINNKRNYVAFSFGHLIDNSSTYGCGLNVRYKCVNLTIVLVVFTCS